ncbi:MAG TPA: DUF4390 domain-containing protein, partial [Gammaproteobacteria bacterium]|nr:DUF4390 domain-containing protein [Gammaproteobacteria bacterium]
MPGRRLAVAHRRAGRGRVLLRRTEKGFGHRIVTYHPTARISTCALDRCRFLLFVLLLACLCKPAPAAGKGADDDDVHIRDTRSLLVDGVYRVGARVDIQLNDTLQEALHNGVPLTINLTIEVVREREWLFPERVAR